MKRYDFITPYVTDASPMSSTWSDPRIRRRRSASIRSAALACITGSRSLERYRLDATHGEYRDRSDLRFKTLDWDGKIRMDCSSPYAMAKLIGAARQVRCRFRQ